jgi:hypothetical protein
MWKEALPSVSKIDDRNLVLIVVVCCHFYLLAAEISSHVYCFSITKKRDREHLLVKR